MNAVLITTLPKESIPLKKISKEVFFNLLCEDIFVASFTDELLDLLHRCVWLHHLVEGKKKKKGVGSSYIIKLLSVSIHIIYIYIIL